MAPNEAVGGWMPRPRNVSPTSAPAAAPSEALMPTMIQGSTAGKRCRTRMRVVPAPIDSAARMKSVSRNARVWARTKRAVRTQPVEGEGEEEQGDVVDALIDEELGADEIAGRFPPLGPLVAQGGADHDQHEQTGDSEDDVTDTHDDGVHFAPLVARQQPQTEAKEGVAEEERESAEDQGGARREEGPAEQVAAIAIGAKEMVQRRSLEVLRMRSRPGESGWAAPRPVPGGQTPPRHPG